MLKRNVLSANDLSKRENDVRQMLLVCEDGGAFRFKQVCPTRCGTRIGAAGDVCM